MLRTEKEHVLNVLLYNQNKSPKTNKIPYNRTEYQPQLIENTAAQGARGGNQCPDKHALCATYCIFVERMRKGNSTGLDIRLK